MPATDWRGSVRGMKGRIVVVALLFFCGCEPEPSYQGKTASEWVKLSRDKDEQTREEALAALVRLKGDSSAASGRLKELYSAAESDSGRVKYGVYVYPDHADDIFAAAGRALRAEADAGAMMTRDNVALLIEVDPKRRASLIPDLDYAIQKIEQNGSSIDWKALRELRDAAAKP